MYSVICSNTKSRKRTEVVNLELCNECEERDGHCLYYACLKLKYKLQNILRVGE